MEREMFFGVWDRNKQLIFGQVLEELEEAKELVEKWEQNPRAGFIGVNWRRKDRSTGFRTSKP